MNSKVRVRPSSPGKDNLNALNFDTLDGALVETVWTEVESLYSLSLTRSMRGLPD
jgi:hypothetical protein